MNTPASSQVSGFELHALTPSGLRPLSVAAATASVHELLDCLPYGVYSALRTFGHERFLWLDAHFDRTERSMASLGWTNRLDREGLRRALYAAVHAYPLPDAVVRFDALREPATIQNVAAEVFVALSPYVPVPAAFIREGVKVELAAHLHRETPRIKTTQFVRHRRPLPLSTREHYEGVLVDEQQGILECSSANIAFIQGNSVIAAGDGVLEGITQMVLRKVAGELGMQWVERRLPVAELGRVDEAFLSSSSRGIVPIVQVAQTVIADGKVGPRTRALFEAYYALAEREAK